MSLGELPKIKEKEKGQRQAVSITTKLWSLPITSVRLFGSIPEESNRLMGPIQFEPTPASTITNDLVILATDLDNTNFLLLSVNECAALRLSTFVFKVAANCGLDLETPLD